MYSGLVILRTTNVFAHMYFGGSFVEGGQSEIDAYKNEIDANKNLIFNLTQSGNQ